MDIATTLRDARDAGHSTTGGDEAGRPVARTATQDIRVQGRRIVS